MLLPPTPFTRGEAHDLGIRDHQWRELVHDLHVREAYPGLYVDAALADTLQLRLAIAERLLTPDLVVARRTSAWLDGLDVLDHRGFPQTPPLEVLTGRQELRSKSPLLHTYVADDIQAADLRVMGALQVTTPMRTAADLMRYAPRSDALVVADAYLHRDLLSQEVLRKSLVRWRGRRGVRQAYEIIDLADGRSQSGGESRMRLRVIDMGLPRPELQIPVLDLFGIERYLLDLGYRRWRLGLEYDGEEFHGPEHAEHDESRRTWIGGRGWTVRAFRKMHIFTTNQAFETEVMELVNAARSGGATPGYPLSV